MLTSRGQVRIEGLAAEAGWSRKRLWSRFRSKIGLTPKRAAQLIATSAHPTTTLRQRSIPDRLAGMGLPVLVIFGTDDRRWSSSSADAYSTVPGARVELLPGVGHTRMLEDPQATGKLLLDFAAATARPC
jgi:pimeloyl-ACP methyl ester carboxylesterase